jgi:hypothetical protein
MLAAILTVATGIVSATAIWLVWRLYQDYEFSDYTKALNDGHNWVIEGCFEKRARG